MEQCLLPVGLPVTDIHAPLSGECSISRNVLDREEEKKAA
jgi:hypothetical protein